MRLTMIAPVILCCGCASTARLYQGPPKQKAEIAVLHCTVSFQPYSVDDVKVNGAHGANLELLPGEHKLIAGLALKRPSGVLMGPPHSTTFTAAAGSEYYCVGDVDEMNKNWALDIMSAENAIAASQKAHGFNRIRRQRTENGDCYDFINGTTGNMACPDLPPDPE